MNNDSTSQVSGDTFSPTKKTNRFTAYGAIILLVLLAVFLITFIIYKLNHKTTATTPRQAIIQVTAGGFVPSTLTVEQGTAIVWKNIDHASHTIASNPYPADSSLPGLHSKSLLQGSTYSYTPSTTQTIVYHDDQNPTLNGTIIIKK